MYPGAVFAHAQEAIGLNLEDTNVNGYSLVWVRMTNWIYERGGPMISSSNGTSSLKTLLGVCVNLPIKERDYVCLCVMCA